MRRVHVVIDLNISISGNAKFVESNIRIPSFFLVSLRGYDDGFE